MERNEAGGKAPVGEGGEGVCQRIAKAGEQAEGSRASGGTWEAQSVEVRRVARSSIMTSASAAEPLPLYALATISPTSAPSIGRRSSSALCNQPRQCQQTSMYKRLFMIEMLLPVCFVRVEILELTLGIQKSLRWACLLCGEGAPS